jgi:CheY-like chemotaxis protein
MYRPEPQTRRGSSRAGPDSSLESGPFRENLEDPWLHQRQVLHDAANWLTVLSGHVEALRGETDEAEFARHRELARRAVRAALRLCGLPPGTAPVRASTDAGRIARRVVEHLRRAASTRGIELECECREPKAVLTDIAGLEDALLNLVRNALEAAPRGSRVMVRVLPESPEGFATISVEDEGPGIDESVRRRLGRPGASSREGVERGLGLSRVVGWLDSVGANLAVDSNPGVGTRMSFSLPISRAGDPAISGDRARILLVEDDLAVAEVISLLLRGDGHPVLHAADLADARDRVRADRPDVVLCDQGLPDGSGMELLDQLARERSTAIRILLTGDATAAAEAENRGHLALAKPVGRDDLRRVLRGVVRQDPPSSP